MAPASSRRKHAHSFVPDDLVVATPHLDLVAEHLHGRVSERARDARLGLTLLRLDDVEEVAARYASGSPGGPQLSDRDPLDIVLSGIRRSFADRWDGWTPTLGKNRDVLGGETPYLKSLSTPTPPVPVDAEDDPYSGAGARARGHGGDGVRLGLLDTAVLPGAGSGWLTAAEPDRLVSDGGPTPYRLGHATFLSGLLHQYAPRAEVVVRSVLAGPDATGTAWDVAVGLLDLAPAVDVVVMALGCFTVDRRPPLVLQTAMNMVRDDVVLMAAAGNYADMSLAEMRSTSLTRHTPMWPAAFDGVVAVGSMDAQGHASAFSPGTPWVDLLAPGEGLASTYLHDKVSMSDDGSTGTSTSFDGFARWSGTSLSVAVAAGRLAACRREAESLHDTAGRLVAEGDAPFVVRVRP